VFFQHPTPGDTLGRVPLVRKLILRIYGLADLFLGYLSNIIGGRPEIESMRTYIGHLGPIGDASKYPKKVIIIEVSNDGEIIRSLQTNKSEVDFIVWFKLIGAKPKKLCGFGIFLNHFIFALICRCGL